MIDIKANNVSMIYMPQINRLKMTYIDGSNTAC